jgi:hypothetical protein
MTHVDWCLAAQMDGGVDWYELCRNTNSVLEGIDQDELHSDAHSVPIAPEVDSEHSNIEGDTISDLWASDSDEIWSDYEVEEEQNNPPVVCQSGNGDSPKVDVKMDTEKPECPSSGRLKSVITPVNKPRQRCVKLI